MQIPIWMKLYRPGYFGRKRDQIIKGLNAVHGKHNWRIAWVIRDNSSFLFEGACKYFYEDSYFHFLSQRPDLLDIICSYEECIDNADTNIQSGTDYTKQESFSTHIQDIAVRNVLERCNRKFEGKGILTIRSSDSNGYQFGPGNVMFVNQAIITQPSLKPRWANPGSVEDFWQSNKWIEVLEAQEK